MLDIQSGGPETKPEFQGHNLNPLQVHRLHQLISQPTHLLPQIFCSIDLILADQPNLIVDSCYVMLSV